MNSLSTPIHAHSSRATSNLIANGSRHLACLVFLVLALAGLSTGAAVVGNIDPLAIEIDLPSANLYPSGAPGFVDWVKDSLPNTDPPSLINSIAIGIIPNVTGAAGG